mmetsp:Transcript_20937/g.49720  ORF Transcript_20937/g.49720 Transcript_20937/m.49720 type:complete len:302 (-) Transcript_20937:4172-5077(-)
MAGDSMAGISCAQLARFKSAGQRCSSGASNLSLVPPKCATKCSTVDPPARPTRQQSSPGKASSRLAGEQCGRRTSAARHSPDSTAKVKAESPLSAFKSGLTPVDRRYLQTSRCPPLAAKCKALAPVEPFSLKKSAIRKYPHADAPSMGSSCCCWLTPPARCMSAPRTYRNCAAWRFPARADSKSGETPKGAALGSKPRSSSTCSAATPASRLVSLQMASSTRRQLLRSAAAVMGATRASAQASSTMRGALPKRASSRFTQRLTQRKMRAAAVTAVAAGALRQDTPSRALKNSRCWNFGAAI